MNQPHPIALLIPEIKELLSQKEYALIKQVLRECNPIDFADVWKRFSENERLHIFSILSNAAALKLFEVLELEDQKLLLSRLADENLSHLLEGMDSPDLAKIFHKMSPRSVKKMTGLIKRQEALAHIDYLMKFPENTAGSLMHPEFVKLGPRITAKQALHVLQAIARPFHKDHLYSLFVTDEEGRVLGALEIKELLSSPEDEKLSQIMHSVEGYKLTPLMDQEDVAKTFEKFKLSSAPVVDEMGRLIGVVTAEDMLAIVKQEASEDIAKMAGTQVKDLAERSIFKSVWFRMPWLLVTLVGGILISMILKRFELTTAKIIALTFFSPLIAGMGGNVGSQSATIMVRNIALGHIGKEKNWLLVVREMFVGLTLGALYGTVIGLLAYIPFGSIYHYQFSLVIAVAMCTAMTVSATMGAIIPLVFNKMGIDPAMAAGPLISTTTDIISNVTYFSLATFLLFSLN